DHRGGLGDHLRLERNCIELSGVERDRSVDRARRIIGRMGTIEHNPGDGPVDEPGVEVMQPVHPRDLLGDRALARRRRAVDGDDHDKFAPSPRINSTKPGKLVAMKLASSTLTGFSLANPMTSAAMAMR